MAKITYSEVKKIINLSDRKVYDNLYQISLYNYDNIFYLVIADYEQAALDILVDFLEQKKETGHIYTHTELLEDNMTEEEIDDNYTVAGNYCNYVNIEHLSIITINE